VAHLTDIVQTPKELVMKTATISTAIVLWLTVSSPALATTYGSVEPIATPDVIDTSLLKAQRLDVRAAFAERLLQCGIIEDVVSVLVSNKSITTINGLNAHIELGAGGFFGETNPSYVFTVIDSGPNAASHADIKVVTDSLAYVMSQASAFLLDADGAASFDFPANYVVLNFRTPPSMKRSAALFETVGRIDPALFNTDTSGYTQFGRAYLSLQSAVENQQFIDGYVEAARQFGVEYTPIVGGVPSLFEGGAAFPSNNWVLSPQGEEYLGRIPAVNHRALRQLRHGHLRFTRNALRSLGEHDDENMHGRQGPRQKMSQLKCQ
jgi:hypothetical protein